MNLPGINYYNNVAIYADITYQMAGNNGPWDSSSGAAPLDATGAPTVTATSAFSNDYPTGQYTATWDGTGSLKVNSNGTMGQVTSTTTNGVQHNTATLTLTQNINGANWTVLQATPPITNIHIMAPASMVAPGTIYMADYLARLRPFSTYRFMDALNTNGNTIVNWSQRTWPTAGSRATQQGVAYEDIIALANATGKDVWINIPVRATDDYVCRLARLFRYGEPGDKSDSPCSLTAPSSAPTGAVALNSNSKVYVEFSNEIWNWGFQQIEDVFCMVWGVPDQTSKPPCQITSPNSAMGKAALANTSLPWSTNTWAKAGEFAMVLTKRDNDIFKTVFGSRSAQIKTAMNVQSAWAAEADDGFTFMTAAYGPVTGYMDVMAVAPYFNLDTDSSGSDTVYSNTVDEIFADLQNVVSANPPSSSNSAIAPWLAGDLAEANKFNLPVVAYEGGQGLSGSNNETNKTAAQTDPRMYTMYQQYFALWNSIIGKDHLFIHYTFISEPGQWGAWGALLNEYDPGSQKFDALLSLTLLPGDANLDGTVDSSDCAILKANFGKSSNMFWMEGDFNHDGVVDAKDLALLNQNIVGATCVAP